MKKKAKTIKKPSQKDYEVLASMDSDIWTMCKIADLLLSIRNDLAKKLGLETYGVKNESTSKR